jgi:hypothetical protein
MNNDIKVNYYRSSSGKKWFFHLKKDNDGLLKYIREEDLHNRFIIVNKTNNLRLYTDFENYIDYINFINKIPEERRCCDEVIIENRFQKMRFDIDAKKSEINNIQKLLDSLIDSIIFVMNNKNITIDVEKDIIICSSNNDEKWSYHLIIDNYYCENEFEAKEWYNQIINLIDYDYHKFVDHSIYSSNHTLRILGCTKENENRKKIFIDKWIYHDKTIQYKYRVKVKNKNMEFHLQLMSSLITFVDECKLLPKIFFKPINHFRVVDEIDDKLISWIDQLLRDKDNSFKFDKKLGNILLYNRIKSSDCLICDRVHENENIFLKLNSINTDIDLYEYKYEIYLYCRRAEKDKKYKIGLLEKKKFIENLDNNKQIISLKPENRQNTKNLKISELLELSKKENKKSFLCK